LSSTSWNRGIRIGDEFITLARVIKTQGRRGEVAAQLYSDVPDRFIEGLRVFALASDGARRELRVQGFWPHKGRLILKFESVDSIDDAEMLLGCELQVPRGERAQLEAGWTYISDLVGCTAFDRDREIGKIQDVEFGAGEAPLLIVKAGSKSYDIPFAEAYLANVDLGKKEVRMLLPGGMLDINLPLTAEEKAEQGAGRSKRKT
jgi:16S rRNA processing protein RimM